jgi:hypothetical protein
MTGTPGSEGGPGKRARRKAGTTSRADPATGIAHTGHSDWRRRVLPPILMSPAKLAKVGCTGVTCAAVSCMSTDELHEHIYAPHAP